MEKISSLTFRYMKVNLKRTISTCIGVIVSTILIYMIFSIGYSLYFSSMEEMYKETGLNCDGLIICDGAAAKEIVALAQNENKNANDAGVELSYAWAVAKDNTDNLRYNYFYFNDFSSMPIKLRIIKGTFPKNENSILITENMANDLNVSIGSKFEIKNIKGESVEKTKAVSGFFDDLKLNVPSQNEEFKGMFWDSILNESENNVFNSDEVFVFVTLKDGKNLKEQINKLGNTYNAKYIETSEAAILYYNPEKDLGYTAFRAFLLLVAFIGIMISVLIIRNAFNISVHTRSKDYGILRCIGMSRRQIILIILGEALVIGVIGLIFGLIAGHMISVYVFAIFKSTLKLSAYYRIRLVPEAILLSAFGIMLATFYSMISPIEKLFKINPVNALRMTDEYKLNEKKLKPNRGKILGKLFGVEAGYAYKNALRDKKRFLLLTVTLTIWTILAVAVFTIMSSTKKAFYDMTAPKCDYDGAIDYYDESQQQYMIDMIKESEEVKSFVSMDMAMIKDEPDGKITWLCYGFSDDEYKKFAKIAEGYDESNNPKGVLICSNKYKTGDTFYGKAKVAGIINDYDSLKKEFEKYIEYNISAAKFSNVLIYNIDDTSFMKEACLGFCYHSLLIEFKNELSHPVFDKKIKENNLDFSDWFIDYKETIKSLKVTKMAVISFLILIFILYMINTININSAEMLLRNTEFNILRTIGMSKKQVDKMLYLEGVIISVIAAIPGSILGSIAGNVVVYFMMFSEMEDDGLKFTPHIDPLAILFITVILLFINIFAVFITKPENENISFE
ncbi:MAG: ABC transporter permease [Lachnospiraceae bacterium]|nr:ABC transporter permease [Lachnospiraceae bacterium]